MEISLGLVKELGYSKIDRYYKDLFDISSIKKSGKVSSREKLSAYSIANEWNETFGKHELKYVSHFVEWYKMYYPTVGTEKNCTAQSRVFKAYTRLRADYVDSTGRDLGDFGIYAPKLEINTIEKKLELSKEEITFLEYIDNVYLWGIKCASIIQIKDRDSFECYLRLLSYDTKEFLEKLREC